MNKSQFSERIGNIDERLVEQAERVPNYARQGRQRLVRRIAAAAAALAVMVCGGFGLGATVFAQEIEVPVEVPVEQETITYEDMGVTLILPDSWRGQYGVDSNGSVYALGARDEYNPAVLFWIDLYPEQLTKDFDGQAVVRLGQLEDVDVSGQQALHHAVSGQAVHVARRDVEQHPQGGACRQGNDGACQGHAQGGGQDAPKLSVAGGNQYQSLDKGSLYGTSPLSFEKGPAAGQVLFAAAGAAFFPYPIAPLLARKVRKVALSERM